MFVFPKKKKGFYSTVPRGPWKHTSPPYYDEPLKHKKQQAL